jgi:two-component system, NtrC family, nitrogen regulation sensor histidine kinase NtrY
MSARFTTQLLVRLCAVFALLAVMAYTATSTEFRVIPALAGALAVLQAALVVRFVARTNRELVRFVDALRYDDASQSFSIGRLGASFADLERSLTEAAERFGRSRRADAERRRYLETLVEHVPVALIALHDDGNVELLNSAARRLLNAAGKSNIDALDAYGAAFQRDLAQSRAGGRALTRATIDGVDRHLVLSTTQITIGGSTQRLTSLQDIQGELDQSELSTWQDMVRVLSHEILNSLTPIASLARTADEIVRDLQERAASGESDEMADLRDAVQTVARRSDGLLGFVRSYRQLTQLPPPSLRPVGVGEYFRRLETLVAADWSQHGIALVVRQGPPGLTILADEGLLDQAMLNLLRNAADAVTGRDPPRNVWLASAVSERGRPVIEIADNGPGFADEIRNKIFLPFFTTKADGSGIGLALVRQIMMIHKGAITATARPGGGALFRLTF